MTLAYIPSPSTAVWDLGLLPVRAYALCIIAGIAVACWLTERRLRQRGAQRWAVLDIAVWAVPFGIVGARIYHVLTSWNEYFGDNGDPLRALKIWEGGLGVWGSVAGGAVGAWLACRQLGIPLTAVADALAPGLPLAQAVGRIGNWFNNELFGGRTTLPWGLQVHDMDPDNPGHAALDADGKPILLDGLYHPAFLYEAVWDVGVAVLVIYADRVFKFGKGRAFALYVMAYTAGRLWIEAVRTDPASHILGLRLNMWTSMIVFVGALIYFLRVRGAREYLVPVDATVAVPVAVAAGGSPEAPAEETRPGAGGYRVVSEAQFLEYRATGVVPDDGTDRGGAAADGTDDDGADLVEAGKPTLDDFADDSDDEVEVPRDEAPDDEDSEPAGPGSSTAK